MLARDGRLIRRGFKSFTDPVPLPWLRALSVIRRWWFGRDEKWNAQAKDGHGAGAAGWVAKAAWTTNWATNAAQAARAVTWPFRTIASTAAKAAGPTAEAVADLPDRLGASVVQVDDETLVLRLDSGWNEAYRRRDRRPLAHILADDFFGLTASGEPISKATLMIDPPGAVRSVVFSEQSVLIFGDTGISRGRLQLEVDDRRIDQRFLRVFAKRDGIWQAVAVVVAPVIA